MKYEAPVTKYETTTVNYNVETAGNFNNNDLDARIEAILKMSRDTVQRYGNNSTTNTTYTTTY